MKTKRGEVLKSLVAIDNGFVMALWRGVQF